MKCYYCEEKLATTTHFSQPSCSGCKIDEYIQIENPVTVRERTDEQKALRQKNMRLAFIHAFEEDEDDIRGIESPLERTEEEERIHGLVIASMRNRGRETKEGKYNE